MREPPDGISAWMKPAIRAPDRLAGIGSQHDTADRGVQRPRRGKMDVDDQVAFDECFTIYLDRRDRRPRIIFGERDRMSDIARADVLLDDSVD